MPSSSIKPPEQPSPSGPPSGLPSVGSGGLPPRFELDHDFSDALAHLASIRTRRRLERDPVFVQIRPQLERVLRGFEWDLGPTLGTPLTPKRPGVVRALAWNVERGKRFAGLKQALLDEPQLREADLLLLTEVDIGMGRSQNRNVPRELAAALGMGYVFANYHIVLAEGDRSERGHGVANTKALHGCALLTRFPVLRFAAVELQERRDKFHSTEKRMGTKRALLCELLLPDGPLTVAVVHLDPFTGPRQRADQLRRVLEQVRAFGGERVLLGGDLNTNTYDFGSGRGLAVDMLHKITRFGFAGTVAQYMTPDESFERRVFDELRAGGLTVEGYNDRARGTIYYDIYDPDMASNARDYLRGPLGRWVIRWVERRLAPWSGRVPLRVDWFAGAGLRPREPQVIERPMTQGRLISDHNPIVIDLEIDATAPG